MGKKIITIITWMEFNQKDNTHTHIQIYSMNETITLIEPKKIPAE